MPVLQGHELWVGHNEAPLGMIFWSPLPLLYRHQIESFLSINVYTAIVNLFIFLVYIMLLFTQDIEKTIFPYYNISIGPHTAKRICLRKSQ
jgi:hypothetical protein